MSNGSWMAGAEVLESAVKLARVMQAAPQSEEFQSARSTFASDPGLTPLLSRLRQLSRSLQDAKADGRGLVGTDARELAELQGKIHAHPLFIRQQDAFSSLVEMFQQVNQAISVELGVDFAANAAPRGGSCCG